MLPKRVHTNEPNCICNWIAEHFVLLRRPRDDVLNSCDLTRCYQNCTSPNWIKVQTQPVDSWALCSPRTPKGNNVLKSCETNLVLPKHVHTNWTRLHMHLNSWALCLCAPRTPKRQCPEFLLPTQCCQNSTSPNWLKVQMQMIAEHCVCPGHPRAMYWIPVNPCPRENPSKDPNENPYEDPR